MANRKPQLVQCSKCCKDFNPRSVKGAVHLASCTVYQGHPNYETWAVALWINNEEGSHRYWRETAREIASDPPDTNSSVLTARERAIFALADRMKDEVSAFDGGEVEGLAGDLLNAALSEVRWDSIAESLIDEVQS